MNKKGFTLIELVAVIVIIGIIALITVPFIANIVQNSRRDAFVDSAYSIIDAANQYRATSIMKHEERTLDISYPDTEKKLKLSGALMPDYGNLIMDQQGNIEFKLWSDKAKICITKTKNENKIQMTEIEKQNCHL